VSGEHLRIGYAGLGFGSVKMAVDEVLIYRRALTAGEINQHYRHIVPGSSFKIPEKEIDQGSNRKTDSAI